MNRLVSNSAVVLVVIAVSASFVKAQESEDSSCFTQNIVSVPSRPSFSNGAATTQCGVLEVEYGLNREWPGGGIRQDSLGGGLRLGLTHKLDFHWSSDSFLDVFDGSKTASGFGDTWLGFKYRFHEQTRRTPAVGIMYLAKYPSASEREGLGSGDADHAISILVSKDLAQLHLDFNLIEFLAGRDSGSAFDLCHQFALSGSIPLRGRWGAILEGYGASDSAGNPAFASTMAGLTYQRNPRLTLDGGFDIGVTHAPHKRMYAGITYAITNAYSWLRPNRD